MHVGVAAQLFIMYLANMCFIEKLKSRKFFVIALFLSIAFSIVFKLIQVYITGIFFLFLFLVSIIFTKEIFSTLYYSLITIMLYIYSDNIVLMIVDFFFQGKITNLFRFVIGTILYIVSVLLIKYFTISILKIINSEKSFYKISSAILMATFLFFYLSIVFERSLGDMKLSMKVINNIYVLLYGVVTVFICVSIGYLFIKEYRINNRKKELDFLEEYTRDLEERYEEIRGFRHDYQNILLSVESFIRTNDMDSLKKYFYKELRMPMYVSNEVIDGLSRISDRPLKSLISLKILLAQNLNIKINLTVQNRIAILNIYQIVLVRILGIVLDNSIEEARDIPNSSIDIEIYSNMKNTIFVISNSANTKNLDYSSLGRKGYTTKNGKDRGWGLRNIEKLIDSKPQKIFIETKITDDKFIQIITIKSR